MKCLVTGGAGFIGSHIVQHLLDSDQEVVCLDNFDPTYSIETKKANIANFFANENFEFVKGDILDRELVKKITVDIDYIFHEAALVSVVESMNDPQKTIEINTIGTLNILEAGRMNNIRKIVLASSAAVYGDSPILRKKEDLIPIPKSPYAISKLDCEYASRIYYEEYGLKTTSLRYFNVYGPRQDVTSPYAAVMPIFIKKALRNEDLIIYGDGLQTRDFIFVKDVAHANEWVMSKGDGMTFNVASGSATSIKELADKIIELTGSNSNIMHKEPRKGDIKHSLADISKIKNIGFKTGFDIEKGLGETVEWFISSSNSDNAFFI
jgi:UDP-glucose 4-epimerase